ncbi:MAG: hypothetical protein ACFFHV_20290 [Promethearchaeota archaeon]
MIIINGLGGSKDFERIEDLSINQIIALLLKADKDLNMKTNLSNPLEITSLELIGKVNESTHEKLKIHEDIQYWVRLFKENNVSKDGDRVNKVVKAIQSTLERESEKLSIGAKLKNSAL